MWFFRHTHLRGYVWIVPPYPLTRVCVDCSTVPTYAGMCGLFHHTHLCGYGGTADTPVLGTGSQECGFKSHYPHQRQVAAPNYRVATAKIRTLSHVGGARIYLYSPHQKSNSNTIRELAELILQAVNANEEQATSEAAETYNIANKPDDSEPADNKSNYIIVLTDNSGNQTTYFLNGKTLIRKASGEIFILSENQIRALKYICDLP